MSEIQLTPNPYDLPEFATTNVIDGTTGENNVVEAIQADKNFGWHPSGRRPERNVMNWLHRLSYNNLDWNKNTFFPEVQAAINTINILLSEDYPIIGLNVDINSTSISNYPASVIVNPGRTAVSRIGDDTDIIPCVVNSQLACLVSSVWTAVNNGLAVALPLGVGAYDDLHMFLIEVDPALGSSAPALVFDTSPLGGNILSNAAIAAANYAYFRRLFSFRVKGDPLGSNTARLPYSRIVKNKLTWSHHPNEDDLPTYVSFGGGSGNWIYYDNTLGSNMFPIPGGAPIILDAMFTTTPGAAANRGRIRGALNSGSWGGSDPNDRDPNSIFIDSDEFKYMQTDLHIIDAGSQLFGFKDNTTPYTGSTWGRVYIKGYTELNSDFPI